MSGARLGEIERALQQVWSDELLAVYADELQRLGDPRGEMIAFDLHVDGSGGSDELHERNDALVEAWIGRSRGPGYHVRSAYGFVELRMWDSGRDQLVRLLERPSSAYLRTVRLYGTGTFLTQSLATLAAAPRPWLTHLALMRVDSNVFGHPSEVAVPDGWEAATPHLELLQLEGTTRPLLLAGGHRSVRALVITGFDDACAFADHAWPAVERIDLALAYAPNGRKLDRVAAALARIPRLCALDLARNEPTPQGGIEVAYRYRGGPGNPFDLLAELRLERLARLRLPSLRTDRDVAVVQAALDRMPELTDVHVARTYPSAPTVRLAHPTARIVVPAPVPWPAPGALPFARDLIVAVPDGTHVAWSFHRVFAFLEAAFDGLSRAQRDAWSAIWTALAEVVATDSDQQVAASIVSTAVNVVEVIHDIDERDGVHISDDEVVRLRSLVEPFADGGATVTLRIEGLP